MSVESEKEVCLRSKQITKTSSEGWYGNIKRENKSAVEHEVWKHSHDLQGEHNPHKRYREAQSIGRPYKTRRKDPCVGTHNQVLYLLDNMYLCQYSSAYQSWIQLARSSMLFLLLRQNCILTKPNATNNYMNLNDQLEELSNRPTNAYISKIPLKLGHQNRS